MRILLSLAWLARAASCGQAHYNMLLPSSSWAKKGEVVTFTYQWGHPFEHQLFDALLLDVVGNLIAHPTHRRARLGRVGEHAHHVEAKIFDELNEFAMLRATMVKAGMV